MDKVWLYALVAGIAPALFWIFFWMKEDDDNMPEPKILILKTFIIGGLSALIALAFQALIINFNIVKYNDLGAIILFAFIEETIKFFFIYQVALSTKFNNERMDPVLYMIIGALGFAAVENMFYLIDYIHNLEYIRSIIDGGYRFIGSTLVHTISSAFIGISCSILYFKARHVKIIMLTLGVMIATMMHSLFNIFITSQDELFHDIAFYGSWATIIVILLIFEFLRRDTRVRPRTAVRKLISESSEKNEHQETKTWIKK